MIEFFSLFPLFLNLRLFAHCIAVQRLYNGFLFVHSLTRTHSANHRPMLVHSISFYMHGVCVCVRAVPVRLYFSRKKNIRTKSNMAIAWNNFKRCTNSCVVGWRLLPVDILYAIVYVPIHKDKKSAQANIIWLLYLQYSVPKSIAWPCINLSKIRVDTYIYIHLNCERDRAHRQMKIYVAYFHSHISPTHSIFTKQLDTPEKMAQQQKQKEPSAEWVERNRHFTHFLFIRFTSNRI